MEILDLTGGENDIADLSLFDSFKKDVKKGLLNTPKYLDSKYIYDRKGSELFSQIMQLPEYYLTNSERELIEQNADKIADNFGDEPFNLIELGAGNGRKTNVLIDSLIKHKKDFKYIPVDISKSAISNISEYMQGSFPNLDIQGMVADYFDALKWLKKNSERRNIVLFLGSSVGNFEPEPLISFLKTLNNSLNQDDLLFIGFDLKKDIEKLIYAYNDSNGVTSQFNFNLLERINTELGGDFNYDNFRFYATYNPISGAVESFIVSEIAHSVEIKALDLKIEFDSYEAIHTESSYKFTAHQVKDLADRAGFGINEMYYDINKFFTDALWIKT